MKIDSQPIDLEELYKRAYDQVNLLIPYSSNRQDRSTPTLQAQNQPLDLKCSLKSSVREHLLFVAMRRKLDRPFKHYRFSDEGYTKSRFDFDQAMIKAICAANLDLRLPDIQDGALAAIDRPIRLPGFHFSYALYYFTRQQFSQLVSFIKAKRGCNQLNQDLINRIDDASHSASNYSYLSFTEKETQQLYQYLVMHHDYGARNLSHFITTGLTASQMLRYLHNGPLPVIHHLESDCSQREKMNYIRKVTRNAVAYKMGNCHELACAVAQILMQSKTLVSKDHVIQIISAEQYERAHGNEHVFVQVIDMKQEPIDPFIIDPWARVFGLRSGYQNLQQQLPYQKCTFSSYIGVEKNFMPWQRVALKPSGYSGQDQLAFQSNESKDFFRVLLLQLSSDVDSSGWGLSLSYSGIEKIVSMIEGKSLDAKYIDLIHAMQSIDAITLFLHAFEIEHKYSEHKFKRYYRKPDLWLCKTIRDARSDIAALLRKKNINLDSKEIEDNMYRYLPLLEEKVLPLLAVASEAAESGGASAKRLLPPQATKTFAAKWNYHRLQYRAANRPIVRPVCGADEKLFEDLFSTGITY